jgi:hypothetical protein
MGIIKVGLGSLLLVGLLLAGVAEAGRAGPMLEVKLVELVVRNMAQGSVTFQLGSEEVEVQTGQGAALGLVEVSGEQSVVQVGVTVKAQRKVLRIDLAKEAFGNLGEGVSRRSVVVTAMESWRLKSGKYLVFQVGRQRNAALSVKL